MSQQLLVFFFFLLLLSRKSIKSVNFKKFNRRKFDCSTKHCQMEYLKHLHRNFERNQLIYGPNISAPVFTQVQGYFFCQGVPCGRGFSSVFCPLGCTFRIQVSMCCHLLFCANTTLHISLLLECPLQLGAELLGPSCGQKIINDQGARLTPNLTSIQCGLVGKGFNPVWRPLLKDFKSEVMTFVTYILTHGLDCPEFQKLYKKSQKILKILQNRPSWSVVTNTKSWIRNITHNLIMTTPPTI